MQQLRIVGPDETDPSSGCTSIDSPLARAVLKKHADDEFEVDLPGGRRRFFVVAVSYDGTDVEYDSLGRTNAANCYIDLAPVSGLMSSAASASRCKRICANAAASSTLRGAEVLFALACFASCSHRPVCTAIGS